MKLLCLRDIYLLGVAFYDAILQGEEEQLLPTGGRYLTVGSPPSSSTFELT